MPLAPRAKLQLVAHPSVAGIQTAPSLESVPTRPLVSREVSHTTTADPRGHPYQLGTPASCRLPSPGVKTRRTKLPDATCRTACANRQGAWSETRAIAPAHSASPNVYPTRPISLESLTAVQTDDKHPATAASTGSHARADRKSVV